MIKGKRSLILILLLLGLMATFGGRSAVEAQQETWRIQPLPLSSISGGADRVRLGDFAIEGGEVGWSANAAAAAAPTLTLAKTVTNDDGGELSVADFTLRIDGGPVTSGAANPVSTGVVHTVSEDDPSPGYSASVWGGDCAADGSITLAEGDARTCTITNDDIAPKLTVIKSVNNDNGGTAGAGNWAMDVTGESVSRTGFPGAEAPGVTVTLHPGTYSVNESGGPPGYIKTFSRDCAGIIALGESRTCTITDYDIAPTLTVIKTVVNDHGGTAAASGWNMDIFGVNVSNTGFAGDEAGVTITLDAGTYSVSESGGPSSYAMSLSADCSGAISLGDDLTCTITNDDIPPRLTVIKTVVNDGPNVSSTGFDGAEDPGVTVTLDPGAYNVSESGGPSGYAMTFSTDCSGAIGLGDYLTCTITNNDVAPKLTVITAVLNDNGGSAAASDWTMDITGSNVSGSGFAGAEAGVTITLDPGVYNVGEGGGPSGYAMSFSAGCSGAITLGDDLTCTITNDDIAPNVPTLTVTKKVVNGDGGSAVAGDWNMDITGANISTTGFAGSESGVTVTLDAGAYSVSESGGPSRYAMSFSADCSGVISAGDVLTCTVTNDDGGSAVASDWTMDIAGTNVSSASFAGEEAGITITLDPGAYSVGESGGPSGYAMTLSADCSGAIRLGDVLTCTITNDDIAPRLTVIKTVVNGGGGSAVASDWTMNIAGTNVSSTGFPGPETGVTVTLDPGAYSVGESGGPSGYAMSRSADCSGAIGLGDVLTCTIVDDDITAQLTVIKTVVNDNGSAVASDWTMDIAGPNVSSTGFDGAEDPGVTMTLDPGIYSVSESGGPSGYAMTLSADCSGAIGLGDDLTCTITNDDIDPQLTVIITVVNDNGSASASDWTIDITGANVSSTGFFGAEAGVTVTLDPGAYNVGESGGPSGYAMTFSADCSGAIGLGDDLTCTITNDDIAPNVPTLTVTKKVVNDEGGSASASDWTMDITGANVSSTGFAGAEAGVTITLDPGAYSVGESGGPSGYAMTFSADCSGAIGLGDDLTCTITNDDEPAVVVPVTNALPTASIISPVDGSTSTTNFSIAFNGSGDDAEDGILTGDSLVWTSNIDGEIGTGQSFTGSLGAGNHTITLTATDSQGASASTSVAFTINIPGGPGGGGGGGGFTPTPTPQVVKPTGIAEPTAATVPPTPPPAATPTPQQPAETPMPAPNLTPQPDATPVPTQVVPEGATPVPAALPSPPDSTDGGGFSIGALIGIALGVIAVFAAIIVIDLWRTDRLSAAARSRAIWGRYRWGRVP